MFRNVQVQYNTVYYRDRLLLCLGILTRIDLINQCYRNYLIDEFIYPRCKNFVNQKFIIATQIPIIINQIYNDDRIYLFIKYMVKKHYGTL